MPGRDTPRVGDLVQALPFLVSPGRPGRSLSSAEAPIFSLLSNPGAWGPLLLTEHWATSFNPLSLGLGLFFS